MDLCNHRCPLFTPLSLSVCLYETEERQTMGYAAAKWPLCMTWVERLKRGFVLWLIWRAERLFVIPRCSFSRSLGARRVIKVGVKELIFSPLPRSRSLFSLWVWICNRPTAFNPQADSESLCYLHAVVSFRRSETSRVFFLQKPKHTSVQISPILIRKSVKSIIFIIILSYI